MDWVQQSVVIYHNTHTTLLFSSLLPQYRYRIREPFIMLHKILYSLHGHILLILFGLWPIVNRKTIDFYAWNIHQIGNHLRPIWILWALNQDKFYNMYTLPRKSWGSLFTVRVQCATWFWFSYCHVIIRSRYGSFSVACFSWFCFYFRLDQFLDTCMQRIWYSRKSRRPHALHAGSDFVLQQVAHI